MLYEIPFDLDLNDFGFVYSNVEVFVQWNMEELMFSVTDIQLDDKDIILTNDGKARLLKALNNDTNAANAAIEKKVKELVK